MASMLLKIVRSLKGLYVLLKVDFQQLYAIITIKLAMDNRRQLLGNKKDNQESAGFFLWTLFFYTVFGGFMALSMYTLSSFMFSMVLFFSYLMVMITMTLIADFSSVLLDTSDNTIILPRPVDSRTLFVARITHILLYLGQLTLCLAFIPTLVVLVKYGVVFSILFAFAIILIVITAVAFTNVFYLLLMQFASEEKLKNIINYFQIVMAVVVMAGYQIFVAMLKNINLENQFFEYHWYSFIMPPVWMATALETYQYKIMDVLHLSLCVIAIVLPLVVSYLVNVYLTPQFNNKLSALGNASPARGLPKTAQNNFIFYVAKLFTTSACERSSFELVYKTLARDRKIKLKVYPAFGYVLAFGVVFLLRNPGDFTTTLTNLPATHYHIILLYLTFMIVQIAMQEIAYSDDFKASWIYFSAPINKPGDILTGTVKAIFTRLFLPGYLILSALVFFIWGKTAIDDIVFAFFNNYLMLMILAVTSKKHLPLSMAPNVKGQTGNLVRSLLTVLIIGILGLLHYLLAQKPLLLISVIPILCVAIFFLLKKLKRTHWQSIAF